ncbi:MAG: hypothetical protein EOP10_01870 [Proteobacteria bacterium]|nr:MAG: hypothetical protein EOP10_01870 [Pseudomonadota bacterium]
MKNKLKQRLKVKSMQIGFTLLGLNAFACGKSSKSDKQDSQASVANANLIFDESLSTSLTADIGKDLNSLRTWYNDKNVDSINNLKKILNLNEISGPILESWFYDRIQYVISYKTNVKFSYAYAVDRELVNFDIKLRSSPNIVAANLSAGLIEQVKDKTVEDRDAVFLHINGLKKQLLSAHKGVMMIGAGYEIDHEEAKKIPIVNSIRHIAAMLHEARHSDGNVKSKTLGMSHVQCPASKGEELEGQYACDNSWNGPYNVGAYVSEGLAAQCSAGCTENEKLILSFVILDLKSRILVENKAANYWDATPEKSLPTLGIDGFTTFEN